MSDRYGRRPALLIGLTASAIAYVVFGFAESLWLLFLSRLVQGAGGGTTGVVQAYVADTIAPERARQGARLALGRDIGRGGVRPGHRLVRGAPGPGGAGAGRREPLPDQRHLRLEVAAGITRPATRGRPRPGARSGIRPGPRSAIPAAPVSRLLWIYGVGMLAFSSMTSVLALYLGAEFGLDERTIGSIFIYVGVLSFVMRSVLLGPIVDRIGELWAMRLGT